QQVLDPAGDQCAQWDLERQGADVDVVVAAGAGGQVDPVAADADRVGGPLGLRVLASETLTTGLRADVLLPDGDPGAGAPGLANVRMSGQAVGGPEQVGAEAQARPAEPAVGPGRLGLHPVE